MKKSLITLVGFWMITLMLLTTVSASENPKAVKIFKTYGCNECHSIASLNLGKTESEEAVEEDDGWGDEEDVVEPPDLSDVGSERTAKWMSTYLRKKTDIDGRQHKKRFKGSKEERHELVLWLETLVNPVDEKKKTETPKQ